MSTERALVVSEHVLADRERRDATADGLDHPGILAPQDSRSRPDEPGEQSHEEGLSRPARAVRPIHRRGTNLDEHLVVPDGRLLHLSDPNHLRWAVPGIDRRLHTGTVATAPHRTPRRATPSTLTHTRCNARRRWDWVPIPCRRSSDPPASGSTPSARAQWNRLWLGDHGVAQTVAQAAGTDPAEGAAQAAAGAVTGRFTARPRSPTSSSCWPATAPAVSPARTSRLTAASSRP